MSVQSSSLQHRHPYHRRSTVCGDLGTFGSSLGRLSLVGLVNGQVTSNSPLGSANALSGLVQLGSHVEVANLGLAAVHTIKDHERVNLEVGKVQIDIYAVQTDKEVHEGLLLLSRDVLEEGLCDDLAGREGLGDREVEHERFGVDIADIDTTLVGEEDRVALTRRGDADVVFGVGGMREEGLDDEVVQSPGHRFDLVAKFYQSRVLILEYAFFEPKRQKTGRSGCSKGRERNAIQDYRTINEHAGLDHRS